MYKHSHVSTAKWFVLTRELWTEVLYIHLRNAELSSSPATARSLLQFPLTWPGFSCLGSRISYTCPLATAPGYSAGAGADSVACWLAVARRSGRQSWSAWWQICRCSRVAMLLLLLMMMTCLLWWTARLQHVARRHRLTASHHSSLLDLMSHNF